MWRFFDGADIAALAEEWAWAMAVGGGSIFQTFDVALAWSHVFSTRARMRVWWHEDPPLIVPLAAWPSRMTLWGEGLFDYSDLIGSSAETLQLEAADRVLAEHWHDFQVTGIPARTPFAPFWQRVHAGSPRGGLAAVGHASAAGSQNPFSRSPEHGAPGPSTSVPPIPSALAARLDEAQIDGAVPFAAAPRRVAGLAAAAQLEREHPRLLARWLRAQQHGVRLRRENAPAERAQVLEWLLEHQASHCAARALENVLGDDERDWLRTIIHLAPAISELWSLRHGDAMLAALLCWRQPRIRYGYTIAYAPAAGILSPGMLLLFAVVRCTMEAGWIFDFLTGEQPYKLRLANENIRLLRFHRRRHNEA